MNLSIANLLFFIFCLQKTKNLPKIFFRYHYNPQKIQITQEMIFTVIQFLILTLEIIVYLQQQNILQFNTQYLENLQLFSFKSKKYDFEYKIKYFSVFILSIAINFFQIYEKIGSINIIKNSRNTYVRNVFICNTLEIVLILNLVLCICYNNGLKSLPLILFFCVFLFIKSFSKSHSAKHKFKIISTCVFGWYMLFLQIFTYICNIQEYKDLFLSQDFIILFGKGLIQDQYDLTKEILNFVLFLSLFLYSVLLKEIISLQKSSSFEYYLSQKRILMRKNKRNFYIIKLILKKLHEHSTKLAQISLIVWGLTRISWIKFTFLLLGLIGLLEYRKFFKVYLFKISLYLSATYLLLQTSYNQSYIDVFFKSFGNQMDEKMFKIGFYKYYNLFHGHLLKFKYTYDEIKVKRKQGMIMDTVIFAIFFLLYRFSLKKMSSQKSVFRLTSSIAQNAVSFFEDLKFEILKLVQKNTVKFIMIFLLYISQLKLSVIHSKYLLIFIAYLIFYNKKYFILISRILIYIISIEIIIIYLYKITDLKISENFVMIIGLQYFEDNLLYSYKEHLITLVLLIMLNRITQNQKIKNRNQQSRLDSKILQNITKQNSLIIIYIINLLIILKSDANIFLLFQFSFLLILGFIKQKNSKNSKLLTNYILCWFFFDCLYLVYFYIININIINAKIFKSFSINITAQSIGLLQQFYEQKIQIFYIGVHVYFLRYYYKILKQESIQDEYQQDVLNYDNNIINLKISNIHNPLKWQYKINYIYKSLQFMYSQNFNLILCVLIFCFYYQIRNIINIFIIVSIILVFQINPIFVQGYMQSISLFIVFSYQISHIIKYEQVQQIYNNDNLNSFLLILKNKENIIYYYLVFAFCSIKKDVDKIILKFQDEYEYSDYLFNNYFCIKNLEINIENFKNFVNLSRNQISNIKQEQKNFFYQNFNIYIKYFNELCFIKLNEFTFTIQYLCFYILVPILCFLALIFVFCESNFLNILILILLIIIAKNFSSKQKNNLLQMVLCQFSFFVFFAIFVLQIYRSQLIHLPTYQYIKELVNQKFCDQQYENYKSIQKPFQSLNDYEYCQLTWQQYFFLEFENQYNLILIFIILLVNIYTIHHLKKFKTQQQKVDQRMSIYLKSSKDQKQNLIVFENVPSVILISFFIISGFLDICYQQESLLCLIYTIPGIFLGINGYFFKQKYRYKYIQIFENFNFLFLTILMVYQSPIFQCPIQIDDRKFIGSNECSYMLQDIKNNFIDNQSFSIKQQTQYFIYMNLGLLKIYSQSQILYFRHITMITFFFITIIIKQMWNFQENAQLYFIMRQKNKKKLLYSIKFILDYFITRYWKYDKHTKQKEIFQIRNQEIDERIEQWEDVMNIKSRQNSIYIQNDEEKDFLINKKKKWIENQKSSQQTQAENLVNSFCSNEPILEIQEVYDLYKNNQKQIDINSKILYLQQQKCQKISQQIIELQDLNICKLLNQEFLQILNLWDQNNNHIIYNKILKEQMDNIPDRNDSKTELLEGSNIYQKQKFKAKILKLCLKLIRILKNKLQKNTQIFYRLTGQNKKKLIYILIRFLQNRFIVIIQVTLFLNLLFNGDLVSFIPLILMMVIGITSNPFPSYNFWRILLYYFFILIFTKLIYQLPLFCKTTPYVFSFSQTCENLDLNQSFLYQRIDYNIGIRKFYAFNSTQIDKLSISNFIFDYICLLFIFAHMKIQKKIGLIDFVKTSDDYRQIPILNLENIQKKFPHFDINKSFIQKENSFEKFDIQSQSNSENISQYSLTNSSLFCEDFDIYQSNLNKKGKVIQQIENCFYKIVPIQKELKQNIIVSDKNNIFETLQYEPLFLKSGKNLYSVLFCIEILIFLSVVFFYDTLLGSQTSFASDLQKSQFSEDLVYIILKVIFIILLNRICFCKRYSVLNHGIIPVNKDEDKTPVVYFQQINKKYSEQPYISRHNLTIKYIIYIIIVIVTFYFFLYTVPQCNKNTFIENQGAKIIFIASFIYLNLTGLQIKYGYSNNDIGSPYTHQISPGENLSRKIFMAIPFIFEIKTVLDWTITKTSLDLYQWFKLEDAYITLKITKYQMQVRKSNKFPIDLRKKIIFGFCFLIFLLGLIILPVLLFSTLNPNYVVNEPQRAQFSLKMWAQDVNDILEFPLIDNQHIQIVNLDEDDYKLNLNHKITLNKHENLSQIKKLIIDKYVDHTWDLSPPKVQQIQDLIQKQQKFYITIVWNIYHEQNEKTTSSQLRNTILVDQENLNTLSQILLQQQNSQYLQFKNLIPEVIYLNSAQSLSLQEKNQISYTTVRDVHMKLNKDKSKTYWEINDDDFDQIKFYIHCDYILGNMLGNTLKNMSVVGFYVTVVLAIGQIIKSVFQNITMRVIYEEMPQTNQLIEFCESIYIARKEEDLLREKKLYDILIRIYRSPELLIQLTGNYSKQLNILKLIQQKIVLIFKILKFIDKNFILEVQSQLLFYQLKQIVMNIQHIQQNLYQITGKPFRVYGLYHPIRSFVYRLSSGNLWVLSPVQADDQIFNQLDQMCGPQNQVQYLVSPNKMHWLHIKDWKKRYPNAIVITPKDLAEKLKKQKEDIPIDYYLEDLEINPQQWQQEVDFAVVKGSKAMTEGVFYVKESGKLLITDLIQMHKFDDEGYKIQDKIAYRLGGCGKDGGMPGIFKYSFKWPLGNKKLYHQSLQKIYSWNFNEIFLLHGNSISNDAQNYLKKKLDI